MLKHWFVFSISSLATLAIFVWVLWRETYESDRAWEYYGSAVAVAFAVLYWLTIYPELAS